jgi:cytochrome b
MAGSWKTTTVGILTGVGIFATQLVNVLDADPATTFSVEAVLAALAAMGIGWFARDNDKSSEEVGAKLLFQDRSAQPRPPGGT